jgi:hypothetical protein
VVVNETQAAVAGALVVAVPDQVRRSTSALFRTATTDANGRARFDIIAPGAYTVFATETIEEAAWQDPNVIQRHEKKGVAVTLQEATSQTVTVKVIR